MQPDVEGQTQAVAGCRGLAADGSNAAASGVGLDLRVSSGTAQIGLVGLLDAVFADRLDAGIRLCLAAGLQCGLVARADTANVAQGMRCDIAHGITTEQASGQLDALKAEFLGRESGHFLVAEKRLERQAVEFARLLEPFVEPSAIDVGEFDNFGQCFDGLLKVGDLFRVDLEGVDGPVLGQHDAIAIGDEPTVGLRGHQADAVALGKRVVVVELHGLQHQKAQKQEAESDHDEGASHLQPRLVLAVLADFLTGGQFHVCGLSVAGAGR